MKNIQVNEVPFDVFNAAIRVEEAREAEDVPNPADLALIADAEAEEEYYMFRIMQED